jgi:cytochrome c-type biogenesis protein CcsB
VNGVSDLLLEMTILAYTLAMLAYAAEYAFGSRGVVARIAAGERVLVGAGGPPVLDPEPIDLAESRLIEPHSDAQESRLGRPAESQPGVLANPALARIAGWVALGLSIAGWLAQIGCVVTRGLAAHRVPWGNLYEFVLTVCLVGGTAWLVLLARRPAARPLGLFVTLALVLLLGTDALRLYTPVGPLVPALNSYWLKIHVTAAVTASGVLLVGFVAAALALVRSGYDAGGQRFPCSLGYRLPEFNALERLTFRVHAFAFPIWTFAIICGAIWAEAAWGRYWGWDPKETWSFVAWVIYAGYLHARATPSVRRTVTAWIAVVGWVAMMVNLFGVNLVVSGLHSYAGVR